MQQYKSALAGADHAVGRVLLGSTVYVHRADVMLLVRPASSIGHFYFIFFNFVRWPGGLCRWSNIYSKHLLRVLYGSGGGADDADESGLRRPSKDQGEKKRESAPKKAGGETKLWLN